MLLEYQAPLSLASIFLNQQKFNEEELHEIEIDIKNVQEINNRLLKMTEAEIITKFSDRSKKSSHYYIWGLLIRTNSHSLCQFSNYNFKKRYFRGPNTQNTRLDISPGGGIGRRDGLKIRYSKGCGVRVPPAFYT